jgi:amino-acid N-acetyltransferase
LAHVQVGELAQATDSDLPEVLALLRRCELLEDGVREAVDSFWVARSDRKLVACAGLEVYGMFGLLRSVAVDELARGGGLGAKLVERVATSARSRGLSDLFLLTTTAAGFFERRGFLVVERSAVPAQVAESWEFRVGCPQAAVAMRFGLKEA